MAVIMSHSRIYHIRLILRHAWLNLWDKHMTTGRINQVSIRNSPIGIWTSRFSLPSLHPKADFSVSLDYLQVIISRTSLSPQLSFFLAAMRNPFGYHQGKPRCWAPYKNRFPIKVINSRHADKQNRQRKRITLGDGGGVIRYWVVHED